MSEETNMKKLTVGFIAFIIGKLVIDVVCNYGLYIYMKHNKEYLHLVNYWIWLDIAVDTVSNLVFLVLMMCCMMITDTQHEAERRHAMTYL